MSGTVSGRAPVVSTIRTVTDSSMRVVPASIAAEPTTAYVWQHRGAGMAA